MFLLPAALAARGEAIAKGWAGSLTLGAGQFCTNPGIAIVIDGPDADAFVDAAKAAVGAVGPQTMLTDGMAEAYRAGRDRVAAGTGVCTVLTTTCDLRNATPYLFEVSGSDWLADHMLAEEVFGPLGLIVRVRHAAEMQHIARSLQGQLTCTLHLDEADTPLGQSLMPILERKAGRVLANGFPTGVEVVDAQVHGGPYPASTNFGATSVGTLSIRRWLRPVAYQNMPAALLPQDWAE
jgi:NADP-dependent aldehyde dehydrogenase